MNIDKKLLKIYLIALVISSLVVILPAINNSLDSFSNQHFYNLPFGDTNAMHSLFFYLMAFFLPYIAIFIGYALAHIVVRLFCRFSKFSKRIEFVGYAQIARSGKYLRRRYLIQIVFATLLCTNVWIILVGNEAIMTFWLTEEGVSNMISPDGAYLNFVFVPWYWVPIFLTTLLFSTCIVIMDSGLVSIKKLHGQSEFSDTERVGDKLFAIIKGYAGISVLYSFVLLIQTPMGNEGSLVLYPLLALVFILHVIVAIDMFRNIGRKWVFKATIPYYEPELITLNFEKKKISGFDDLLTQ
ncbi:MAG: hypothetical protein JW891_08990 [Candidatus Lokiarchaeota archaeon]|nr:hypothetical protein [Candidatus Lokiarchaeota archaeon]